MVNQLDTLSETIGPFGRYQQQIYFLVCLPTTLSAMHNLAWVFTGAKPSLRCELDNDSTFPNTSFFLPEEILNQSLPWDATARRYSQCAKFSVNHTVLPCEQYVYDTSIYPSSAVMEWNLVCDKTWMSATAQAVYMSGILIGAITLGTLSDKYGRKPVLCVSVLLQVLFSILSGVVPEYYSFVFLRFLTGWTTSGVYLVGFVLGLELVGHSYRTLAGTLINYFFTAAYFTMPLYAYYITSWRLRQIAMGITGLIFLPYWWLIPESVRWLVTHKKTDEARRIIKQAARVNKVELDEQFLEATLDSKSLDENNATAGQGNVLDLFRYPGLRRKSLNIFFNWFVCSGVYYGLSLNTSNLGGNDYLNFMISGAVEIPAYLLVLLTLNRLGRRLPLCFSLVLAGLALMLTLFVPADTNWLLILFAMVGKMAITAAYGIIYLFSAEQFPTVVRNVGMGTASVFARVGGILAPYINMLADVWMPMPLITFGVFSFTAGLLALFLPETLNEKLPDTLEDGENLGRLTKPKTQTGEDLE